MVKSSRLNQINLYRKLNMLRLLCIVLFLFRCYSNTFFIEKSLIYNKESRIAVLPFVVRGGGMSKDFGHILADELSHTLFLKKGVSVVDRSQVNKALVILKITNPYYLSRNELRMVSDTLKASTIVMGIVDNFNQQGTILSRDFRSVPIITLTIKYLDGKTGNLIGIQVESRKGELSPIMVCREIITKLVDNL